MRGWLPAGMFPLALAGGIVLIVLSRSAAAVAACSVSPDRRAGLVSEQP